MLDVAHTAGASRLRRYGPSSGPGIAFSGTGWEMLQADTPASVALTTAHRVDFPERCYASPAHRRRK